MASTSSELSIAALRLRNASPEGWDMFLKVFSNYTQEGLAAMAEAGSDRILGLQGQAQQRQALLRIFNECDRKPKQPTP